MIAMRPNGRQIRAAQYLRMSSEYQKYSIQNQVAAIASYAAKHQIKIVRTYEDAAKSGMSLAGRPALQQLLRDALSAEPDFDAILVFDVSRWGRFLDTDESAHYEFLCKSAGISIHYCAEIFDGDDLKSGLFKIMKRAMAAEYIRETSAKVFAGHCNILRQGFHTGGRASFGIKRILVSDDGSVRSELAWGQRKNLQSDRVILQPGSASETETVRRIFDLYLNGSSGLRIAKILNEERVPLVPEGHWNGSRIRSMLRNEVYVGNLVYNRTTTKLGGRMKDNPANSWVRFPNAFEPIVSVDTFKRVQAILDPLRHHTLDGQTLTLPRDPTSQQGRPTKREMMTTRPRVRKSRRDRSAKHETLLPTKFHMLRNRNNIRRAANTLTGDVLALARPMGAATQWTGPKTLLVNDQFVLRLTVVAPARSRGGHPMWKVYLRLARQYDLLVAARINVANTGIEDFFFLPEFRFPGVIVDLGSKPNSRYRRFHQARLDALSNFFQLQSRGKGFPNTLPGFFKLLAPS